MISPSEQNVCRLCTNHGHNYHHIFNTTTNSIAEKIHSCLPIVVDSNDQLPTHICNACLEALNVSDKLRSQSLMADSILRKQLEVFLLKNIKQEMDVFDNDDDTSEECNATEEVINVPEHRAPSWVCKFCKDEFDTSDDLQQHKYKKHYIENEYDVQMNKYSDNNDNFIDVNHLEQPIVVKQEDTSESKNVSNEEESENENVENERNDISNKSADAPEGKVLDHSINIKEENILHSEGTSIPRTSPTKDKNDKYCSTCNVTIEDKELMQLHHKFHEPRSMFCGRCLRTFPCPYDLYIHKKNAHGMWANFQMKWFCERCEKMISGARSVTTHIKQCKKPTFQCKYCDQAFAYKSQLMTHQRKSHHEMVLNDPDFPKFTCHLCNKTYLDKPTYGDHMRKHRAKEEESFKCPYCAKISTCKLDLNDHIQRRHERKKNFKCNTCSKAFHSEKDLQTHRRMDHSFRCTQCHKQFEEAALLDQHLLQDHNTQASSSNKYSCEQCGVSFSRRKYFHDHQNMHTGEQPYSCKICNKKFSNYSTYYGHQRLHKKPGFSCDYCKKKFISKDRLKEHIPHHQAPEDWPYYCDICKMKFRSDTILRFHMKRYRNTHLRACNVCGLEVLGMHKLRKHMRQEHDI